MISRDAQPCTRTYASHSGASGTARPDAREAARSDRGQREEARALAAQATVLTGHPSGGPNARPQSASAASDAPEGSCHLCGAELRHSFVGLGMSPLCESFVPREGLDAMEPYLPLHAFVCGTCFLAQVKEYVSPERSFRECAYFSSYSTSWVGHARTFCGSRTICGYGAPGKGNMLLNHCGIGPDFLDFTVDRNPNKHGRFTPGMQVPIRPVAAVDEVRPDYLLILPWNLTSETVRQMRHIGSWGGKFIVPIPEPRIVDPEDARP